MPFLPKHLRYREVNGSQTTCCSWTTICLLVVMFLPEHSALTTSKSSKASMKPLKFGISVDGLKELDKLIQINAFASFGKSKTGEVYEVLLPPSLNGVQAFAIRLRTGSLRRRGFSLNEFSSPPGPVVNITTVRVLLVYREFNGITVFTPEGYRLVSPVLGFRVYDAFNLSSRIPMPELNLTATEAPITVRIPFLSTAQVNIALCASFDQNGSVTISNVSSSPNICSTIHSGDFGLVVSAFSFAPASSPAPAPASKVSPSPVSSTAPFGFISHPPLQSPTSATNRSRHKKSNAWKIVLGSAFGAIGVLGILGFLTFIGLMYWKTGKMARMEYEADHGESLSTTVVGDNRVHIAGSSRTRPTLET